MATAQSMMNIFIILFATIAIETLLLIFILWKTPAWTFLMASISKKPLLYIIGKDRMGKFKAFKSENGAGKLGKDGLFHLTENSHTLETGSKTPIYFAFRDLAATLLPEYPAIIQELREKGVIINNIEDIQNYQKMIRKGMMEDLPISVEAYKTYKFHDLENMFPNNLDPTFIDATVQCEIAKYLKMLKMGPQILGGAVILLMVGAVAVFIVQKAFKGNMSAEDCQMMVQAAKCTINAGGQALINATPLA
jgi:hypothetical protein